MYCKVCGKHLYEEITFRTLFKWNYEVHIDCEDSFRHGDEYIAIPMMDQLVQYDYLFPVGSDQADMDYLFTRFMGNRFEKWIRNKDWSIIILLDEMNDESDLPLILQLGSGMVIMVSYFDEMVLTRTK